MNKLDIKSAMIEIQEGFRQRYDTDVEPLINDPNTEVIMKQFARTVHVALSQICNLIEKLEDEK